MGREQHPFVVCVVEEEAAVREALCRLMRSAGFDARAFASGGATCR